MPGCKRKRNARVRYRTLTKEESSPVCTKIVNTKILLCNIRCKVYNKAISCFDANNVQNWILSESYSFEDS